MERMLDTGGGPWTPRGMGGVPAQSFFQEGKKFFLLFCLAPFPGRVWEGSGEQWRQDRTGTPGGSWGRGNNPTQGSMLTVGGQQGKARSLGGPQDGRGMQQPVSGWGRTE